MKKAIAILIFNLMCISHSHATSWTTLQDDKHAKLMLNKHSIAESGKYQKAWVKIQYKKKQQNLEYPDKHYNNAKLLWYFDCKEQKSASIQVYQLLDDEQVFSAAIDVKRARFIEPVPETEIDLAMRYVCKKKSDKEAALARKEAAQSKATQTSEQKDDEKTAKTTNEAKQTAPPEKLTEKPTPEALVDQADTEEKDKQEVEENTDADKKAKKKQSKKKLKKSREKKKAKKQTKTHWSYEGDAGPEEWGNLDDMYASCETGQNQSPINIEKTISAKLKPLKTFHRFPIKNIQHNGHTIQANFKSGNVLALDGVMYQMKQVHFHAPSENTINGQSFPLEAHFVHTDPKGNLAVLAVMFEVGADNKGLKKLWKQLPKKKGSPKRLKAKVMPTDLLPREKGYYRFSGSLTTPPCSEGVIWVLKKSTVTASQAQIDAFKEVLGHDNNRPVQPLNGRMILSK